MAFRTTIDVLTAMPLLFAAGCTVAPYHPPRMPFSIGTKSGTVHAASAEEAERVAGWLEAYAPRVRALLGADTSTLPEISVIQGELPAGRGQYGVCYKPTLERPFIVLLSTQHPLQEFVLVHELVHYDWGGRWDRLSPAMQEGLADEVARSLVPAEASQTMLFMDMSALFNYAGADPCGDLDMRRGEYDALDLAGRNNSRGLGYFVAHRLGIDALRDLCDEAQRNGASRVSAEVLLTRAGLSFTDTQRWYRGSAAE